MNHKRAFKEATALRVYNETKQEHAAAYAAELQRMQEVKEQKKEDIAAVRSETPPNPLLELEMELNGGRRGKIANQRVLYTTLDGDVLVSTLQPGTTLTDVEIEEAHGVRTRAQDMEARSVDGQRKAVILTDTVQLEEALPPIGSVVRVKPQAGYVNSNVIGKAGVVDGYDVSQPTTFAVVNFKNFQKLVAVDYLTAVGVKDVANPDEAAE